MRSWCWSPNSTGYPWPRPSARPSSRASTGGVTPANWPTAPRRRLHRSSRGRPPAAQRCRPCSARPSRRNQQRPTQPPNRPAGGAEVRPPPKPPQVGKGESISPFPTISNPPINRPNYGLEFGELLSTKVDERNRIEAERQLEARNTMSISDDVNSENGYRALGEHIRRLRLGQGLGLREAGRRAQVDPTWWSRLEEGRYSSTDPRRIGKVARVLGVDVE